MLTAGLAIAVIASAVGILFHRTATVRTMAVLAGERIAADEALWRRHNIIGDMIPWAANDGAEATQALFQTVIAARAEVMKTRSDTQARLNSEDRMQAALNALYRAAYADDDLLSVHEFVVIAAYALRADKRAYGAVSAYAGARSAFAARTSSGLWRMLLMLYGVSLPAPMVLAVAPDHPPLADRPLA